jgi:hypothetical protein
LVELEDLFEKELDRPAVEKQMVMTPDEVIGVCSKTKQSEAHEWRLREDEAAASVFGEKLLQAQLLIVGGEVSPVLFLHGQLYLLMHNLHGFFQTFPQKPGA